MIVLCLICMLIAATREKLSLFCFYQDNFYLSAPQTILVSGGINLYELCCIQQSPVKVVPSATSMVCGEDNFSQS